MKALINELNFFLKEQLSYLFETISSLVVFVVILCTAFWIAVNDSDYHNQNYLMGYIVWVLCAGCYSAIVMNIQSDITNRTIEILDTMPQSYLGILIQRYFARLPYDILVACIIFVALKSIFSVEQISYLIVIAAIGEFGINLPMVLGVSLLFSSLILVFKRAQVAIIIGNAVIGLMVYVSYQTEESLLFIRIQSDVNVTTLGVGIMLSVMMLLVGIGTFSFSKRWIKKKGMLAST